MDCDGGIGMLAEFMGTRDLVQCSKLASTARKMDARQGNNATFVGHNPDRPDLLYDAGVVAANLQEYEQAEHYFNAAANQTAPTALQEQALFNAGTMAAKQQNYQQAIEYYEKVLALNSENQQAAHNLKKIKELLQEQERTKKEEEQKKNERQKQQEKQQEQEKSSENKQSQQQSERKEQERSQMHDGKDQSSTQGADKQQQGQKGSDMQQDAQNRESKDMTDKQAKNEQKERERNKGGQPDHKNPSQDNRDTVRTAEHKKESQKIQETKNKEEAASGKQGTKMSEKEEKIARILDAVEDHEQDLQKHFTRYIVQQTMGASSHEQGW